MSADPAAMNETPEVEDGLKLHRAERSDDTPGMVLVGAWVERPSYCPPSRLTKGMTSRRGPDTTHLPRRRQRAVRRYDTAGEPPWTSTRSWQTRFAPSNRSWPATPVRNASSI